MGCAGITEADGFPGESEAGRSVEMAGDPSGTDGLTGGVVMQDIDPKTPRTKAAAIEPLEFMQES